MMTAYDTNGTIQANQTFTLNLDLKNSGAADARDVVVTFNSAQVLPKDTGGVQSIGNLAAGELADVSQKMVGAADLPGGAATVSVTVSYTDPNGTPYSGSFSVTLGATASATSTPQYSGPYNTATPTMTSRAQLVVSSYTADLDPLEPGAIFNLKLDARNLGSGDARAVTLVLGGGTVDTSSGTPVPNSGVQGGGGDLTKFAPLGSSNLYYLGDIPAGSNYTATMKLVVNVDTAPGAYPLKLSFIYNDKNNVQRVDDQVVTLLVYALPRAEVSFYRETGDLFAGQPNVLPLQVTNIGRKSAVLGNMKVTVAGEAGEGAEVQNGSGLVGSLDAGSTFPLDVTVIPQKAGKLDVNVVVTYTDDFNQVREVKQTLTVNVQEAPVMEPSLGPDGKPIPTMPVEQPETFWDQVVRALKGLVGLGSQKEQPTQMAPGNVLPEGTEPGQGVPSGKPGMVVPKG